MKDTTKMFMIGMVLTILVLKPSVGVAVVKSVSSTINTIATAINEKDVVVKEVIIKQETPEDLGNERIVNLLTMIYDKLDIEPSTNKVFEDD